MNERYLNRAPEKKYFLHATTAAATSLLIGLLPSVCLALGLGELEYRSRLGERLQAKVHLLNTSPEISENTLKIRQISQKEAKTLGIELISDKQALEFTLNGASIELKSRQPIKEPYIDILLEITSPTGKVYRTYNIFLDPPLVAKSSTRVSPITNENNQRKHNAEIAFLPKQSYFAAAIEPEAISYTVQGGDSLSKIAIKIAKQTKQPVLVAEDWLYKNNPHAFIGGDKNKIKAAYKIKLPQTEQLANARIAENTFTINTNTSNNTTPAAEQSKKNEKIGYLTISGNHENNAPQEVFSQSRNKTLIADNALIEQLIKQNRDLKDRVYDLENSEYFSTSQKLLTLQQKQITQLKDTVVELTYQYENALSRLDENLDTTKDKTGTLKIASASFFSLSAIEETPKNTLLWGILVSTILTALSIFGAAIRYMGRFQEFNIPQPNNTRTQQQKETIERKETYISTNKENEYLHNHKIFGLPQEEQEKIQNIKSKIKEKVGIYTPSATANTTNIYALDAIKVDEDLEHYLNS